MPVEKLTRNWQYLCFQSRQCQDTLFLWRFDPAQFSKKKINKSVPRVWILAFGKLHAGEHISLSRTRLVHWKSLKTNTSGCIIAGTFHHEGAVSWNHTVKRVWEGKELFFDCTPVKMSPAESGLLTHRLDLGCLPPVLVGMQSHEAQVKFGVPWGQGKRATWYPAGEDTLTSSYLRKGRD